MLQNLANDALSPLFNAFCLQIYEQILAQNNVREALNRVVRNKGASGIDGMNVEELCDYMNANWTSIKQSILARRHKPAPIRMGGETYMRGTSNIERSACPQRPRKLFGLLRD